MYLETLHASILPDDSLSWLLTDVFAAVLVAAKLRRWGGSILRASDDEVWLLFSVDNRVSCSLVARWGIVFKDG